MKRKSFISSSRVVRSAGMFCMAALLSGLTVGCSFEDDLATLQQQVDQLEQKVQSISEQVTAFDKFMKENVTINKVTFDEEKGVYTILLSDNTTIEVAQGSTASMPKIGIAQDEKGAYYWTLDGEPILTPSGDKLYSAPSMRVNSVTGFWEVSADGGATYISTGIKAGENASIIAKVEEDDSFVYFTLADGSSLKVAKTVDFRINILAGKQYFKNSQTRTIGLDMSGVKKHAVYSKPEGWKAVIKGDNLSITSPAASNVTADKSGSVIIQAWFNDGTSDISEVAVTIGTAPHEIKVNSDYSFEITIDPAMMDNWSLAGTAVGVVSYNGFSEKGLIKQLDENTRTEWMFPEEFPIQSSLAEMLGAEPVKGESYVIYAVDKYGESDNPYEAVYTVVSIPDLKIEVSDITFEDAIISVVPKGVSEYYAGVREAVDFDAEYIIDGILNWGEGVLINGTYNGPLSKFAPLYGPKNDLRIGKKYIAFVMPYIQGKRDYVPEDMITAEVEIKTLQPGGTSSVTVSEVETTMTSVSATITKGSGTYKYWAKYFSEKSMETLQKDDLIMEELSKFPPMSEDTYKLKADNLVAGQKGWIITVGVDKNGSYGTINKTEANTSDLQYSDITLSEPEVTVSYNQAVIKFPAVDGIKSYKYIDATLAEWQTSYLWQGDKELTEKLLAMATGTDSWNYNFIPAESDGSVILTLNQKIVNTPYVAFVMGVDNNDVCTHFMEVNYMPEIDKYIDNKKPEYKDIEIEYIKVQDKLIGEWTTAEFDATHEMGSFPLEVKFKPAENCKSIWLRAYDPVEISQVGKIGTGQIICDNYTIQCFPDNPVAIDEFFINVFKLFIVWQDTDGNFYQYKMIDPRTLLSDYQEPAK